MELVSLSKADLWKEWKRVLEALCDDRKNPALRVELDRIEDEISWRLRAERK